MLAPAITRQLARLLYGARKWRIQLRHFSSQHPLMTVADGYAIQREWVKLELADGSHDPGPQDWPDLTRDATGPGWRQLCAEFDLCESRGVAGEIPRRLRYKPSPLHRRLPPLRSTGISFMSEQPLERG